MFDADDIPRGGAWLIGRRGLQDHLDLLATHLIQDLMERRIAGEVHRERFQRAVHGIEAVAADGAYLPLVVLDDHTLEEVVDVTNLKSQIDARVALDLSAALEIADAAAEENDISQRQRRSRLCVSNSVVAWRRYGRSLKPDHAKAEQTQYRNKPKQAAHRSHS